MRKRFVIYRRKRGGMFYVEDTQTGKQESFGTRSRAEATPIANARNEANRQSRLNLQIAKACLAGTDSVISNRTRQNALDAIIETKTGSTQDRWRRAAKQKVVDLICDRVIIETQAEHLLARLRAGTVSQGNLFRRYTETLQFVGHVAIDREPFVLRRREVAENELRRVFGCIRHSAFELVAREGSIPPISGCRPDVISIGLPKSCRSGSPKEMFASRITITTGLVGARLAKTGCRGWNRTSIRAFNGRSATIRRPGKKLVARQGNAPCSTD